MESTVKVTDDAQVTEVTNIKAARFGRQWRGSSSNNAELPLTGVRVLDLTDGIAGAYCTMLLAGGGADVCIGELPRGMSLRSLGALDGDVVNPLFEFLGASKLSVVIDPSVPSDREFLLSLLSDSDIVVWDPDGPLARDVLLHPHELARLFPSAAIVAITPFGLSGPWAGRAATEFTLQCWSGSPSQRGREDDPPLTVGASVGLWTAGMFGAIGALAARRRLITGGQRPGVVDISILESIAWTHVPYPHLAYRLGKWTRAERRRAVPGIYPARDGLVGFMVISGQQWLDFCVMIERPEWAEDEDLLRLEHRLARADELDAGIAQWTLELPRDEIVELATAFRIPASPVASPDEVLTIDHFGENLMFVENPAGFLQPDVPYRLSDVTERRTLSPAPRLGADTADLQRRARRPASTRSAVPVGNALPFEGLRVLDLAQYWAGPVVGHYLGMMGADVIKVEHVDRMDGTRYMSARPMTSDGWWEWSATYQGANTDKRSLTLDLSSSEGRESLLQLVAISDVVIENFSPRVMSNLGLEYPVLREANPAIIMVRMPGYGLTGPWRDRGGFAQTMEMCSGLAWTTGFAGGPPVLPNGLVDPIAGGHATIAVLMALERRRVTHRGMCVEAPMVSAALNVGAQALVEFSALQRINTRAGNRHPQFAPQGVYRTKAHSIGEPGTDCWIGISVSTDEQWSALRVAMGNPAWSEPPALEKSTGRQAHHDLIDTHLATWCQSRTADDIVESLWPLGIPVAKLIQPFEYDDLPQVVARARFDVLNHPLIGELRYPRHPSWFERSDGEEMSRRPAPLLGEHNEEILSGLLGLNESEQRRLELMGIVGVRPSAGG